MRFRSMTVFANEIFNVKEKSILSTSQSFWCVIFEPVAFICIWGTCCYVNIRGTREKNKSIMHFDPRTLQKARKWLRSFRYDKMFSVGAGTLYPAPFSSFFNNEESDRPQSCIRWIFDLKNPGKRTSLEENAIEKFLLEKFRFSSTFLQASMTWEFHRIIKFQITLKNQYYFRNWRFNALRRGSEQKLHFLHTWAMCAQTSRNVYLFTIVTNINVISFSLFIARVASRCVGLTLNESGRRTNWVESKKSIFPSLGRANMKKNLHIEKRMKKCWKIENFNFLLCVSEFQDYHFKMSCTKHDESYFAFSWSYFHIVANYNAILLK